MEFRLIMEIPLLHVSYNDFLWFIIIVICNVTRCIIIFYTKSYKKVSYFIIISTEILLSIISFYNIKYIYISSWSHTLLILADLKTISFLINNINSTIHDYLYFLIIPTLVFKNKYKKKLFCNYSIVFKKTCMLVIYFFIFVFIMDQYAIPSIVKAISFTSIFNFIENFINLSLSTIFLFNLFFQLVFNCAIAIISEITLFDESAFNKWWNSKSAGEFWVKWNLPVHEYMKFHIYKPLLSKGFGKAFSSAICFAASGMLHELVMALSTKSFAGYFFFAMILQIPLIYVSEYIRKSFPKISNIFFWLSFCVIGQPLVVLLYVRSIYIINNAQNL